VQARNDYALALFRQNRYEEAEKEFKICLEIDINNALVHQNIAALYAKKGEFPAAEKHCRKAIEIDPNNAVTHRNLSKILDEGGNTWESLNHNETALSLEKGDELVSKRNQYMTRRIMAKQLVSTGRNHDNSAHLMYDCYRELTGNSYELSTTRKTQEILSKLSSNP